MKQNRKKGTEADENAFLGRPRIRCVTYNILSPGLAKPDDYGFTEFGHLDPTLRLEKIKKKLMPEIENKTIIGLQEVSQPWFNDLLVFFLRNDYVLVGSNYGNAKSDYMGVAIAVPRAFQILAVDITRCTDTYKFDKDAKFSPQSNDALSTWFAAASNLLTTMMGFQPEADFDLCKELQEKNNRIVSVFLAVNKTEKVLVSCYHMPCLYESPQFMLCHAAMALRHVQSLAHNYGRYPLIFLGDFNIEPTSLAYRFITESNRAVACGLVSEALSDMSHEFKSFLKDCYNVDSAMFTVKAEEPHSTCYTETSFLRKGKRQKSVYVGCLDYIFYSYGLKAVNAGVSRNYVRCQPNSDEPSDHNMVYADFVLYPETVD